MHVGHGDSKRDARDAKILQAAVAGVPQPDGNPEWHPIVASSWRSIGKSPEGKWLQPSDWMQLWVAMDILDEQYQAGRFNPGLLREARAIVERLVPSRTIPPAGAEPARQPDDELARKREAAARIAEVRAMFVGGDGGGDDDE